MTFKAVLTHVADDPAAPARLRMAESVARRLGAELIGVGAQAPWPYANADGGGAAFEALVESAEKGIAASEQLFRERLAGSGIATSWRSEVGYPDLVLPRLACAADLVLGYRTSGDLDRSLQAAPDSLVMESGLPLLLMPAEETAFLGEAVLVAWKNTRETRRALSAALPLIKRARRVLVAAVCREPEVAAAEAELAEVARRLARHGVTAVTLAEAASGPTGERLLRIAETDRSDLIVAGAYGHSRMREWVLGGVTRTLIAAARPYVFLSH